MSCHETTEGSVLSQKYHFQIVACLKMIGNTREGATKRTLTSVWKKLWPESVRECGFEGFGSVPVEPEVNKIKSLSKIMGLKVETVINDLKE
ncbi:hypothetical protein AVEN_41506-1 [Araneus ventricosus]|uniref:Uncharacterized protein n=1 Tax=Araneus ventricosus TaxID=182803 RepID=A0A4Y2HBW0_ARAVE|nr:hypothetical protein AVEN_41506-1 [Araneus ventricosus]